MKKNKEEDVGISIFKKIKIILLCSIVYFLILAIIGEILILTKSKTFESLAVPSFITILTFICSVFILRIVAFANFLKGGIIPLMLLSIFVVFMEYITNIHIISALQAFLLLAPFNVISNITNGQHDIFNTIIFSYGFTLFSTVILVGLTIILMWVSKTLKN